MLPSKSYTWKRNDKAFRSIVLVTAIFICGLVNANDLTAVNFSVLPGDRVELRLTLSESPAEPRAFTTENPARIAFDFSDTLVKLANKSLPISVGATRSVTAVEAQGRTRVVINLIESVKYESFIDGNDFVVRIGKSESAEVSPVANTPVTTPQAVAASNTASSTTAVAASNINGISEIDFKRGDQGEGRVALTLTNPSIGIDLRQEGRDVVADFVGVDIDSKLIRKLDVVDFATPVKTIETKRVGDNVRVTVETLNEFEFLAYQTNNEYTIELKPLTPEEVERRLRDAPQYTGERMSLTFQDIQVRAVLQLIADIAKVNMVTSDTVGGSITLQLQNVPWDQALDIILKTKGLDKRQNGNVLYIAPADEIAAREALELQSEQQVEQLAPLRAEFIQVNYAKAATLMDIIQGEKTSFLSERGTVTIDERTNTLLVRDTVRKLDEVRSLVRTLDIPVRQVMIESRIVVAEDGVDEELGVRFGVDQSGSDGSLSGTNRAANANIGRLVDQTGAPIFADLADTYAVNLPVQDPAGRLGVTFARLSDNLFLDLELSALEAENRSEVIASPKVVTANQKEAYIESGEEIPFIVATAQQAQVQFKKAVLSLKVTPQITPDDRIILDLQVTQDTRGEVVNLGDLGGVVPAINTREVTTQVLVDNGETVVLGGIFQQRTNKDVTQVPVLGDIPGLGVLFRRTAESEAKSELLIFVTPKIIKEGVR